ncbi:MAG: hypothetical protein GWO87_02725 [Xanthomonadaceae bacterium]|nr:hypothetical protein [Rhodospirillaceae bacterium]NIA18077.1 hypothetical protein [Xanthomonadaceae bacterium]
MQLEKEKELFSDRCLEQVITDVNDFKKFYESDFVKNTTTEKYGFSELEQKNVKISRKVKKNILDEYKNNEKLLMPRNLQFKHLAGNSTLASAGAYARRYNNKKMVPKKIREIIKKKWNVLIIIFKN